MVDRITKASHPRSFQKPDGLTHSNHDGTPSLTKVSRFELAAEPSPEQERQAREFLAKKFPKYIKWLRKQGQRGKRYEIHRSDMVDTVVEGDDWDKIANRLEQKVGPILKEGYEIVYDDLEFGGFFPAGTSGSPWDNKIFIHEDLQLNRESFAGLILHELVHDSGMSRHGQGDPDLDAHVIDNLFDLFVGPGWARRRHLPKD